MAGTCPKCGNELKEGQRFCSNCGHKTAVDDSPDKAPTPIAGDEAQETFDPAIDSADAKPDGLPNTPTESIRQDDPARTNEPAGEPAMPNPVNLEPPHAQQCDAPHPARHKKCVIIIALALAAIVAVIVGISMTPGNKPAIASKPQPQGPLSGEWCVGTWYGVAMSTTGADNLEWGDYTTVTLTIDASGDATIADDDEEIADGTCTISDDKDTDGGTVYKLALYMDDASAAAWFFGLDHPMDASSLAVVMFKHDTDNIFVFCKDKTVADDSAPDSLDSDFDDSDSSFDSDSSYSSGSSATLGQRNALGDAKSYLSNVGGFSESGLRDQLDFEGYTSSEIDYAIEHCGADWREQCAQSAQQYLGNLDMSRSELYDQLEFDGFTPDQIAYGLSSVGY